MKYFPIHTATIIRVSSLLFFASFFSFSAAAAPYNKKDIDAIIDSPNHIPKAVRDDFEISKELDNTSRVIKYDLGNIYANISLICHYWGVNSQMVTKYQEVSDKILEKNLPVFTNNNLVEYYLIKGFNFGEQVNLDSFSSEGVKTTLLNADLFFKQLNYTEAARFYQLAITGSDSIRWSFGSKAARLGLVRSELMILNRADLVDWFDQSDSLSQHASKKESEVFEREMLAQLQTNDKELEIQQLKYQNQEKKALIVQVIIAAALVLPISFIFFYLNKFHQKLLRLELERQRLAALVAQNELNQAAEFIQANTAIINQLERAVESKEAALANEIVVLLDQKYVSEAVWATVITHFDSINNNFTKKIQAEFPFLKPGDMRLLILINLGYSNKSIARVNNITEDGVKKAKRRLLKKMDVVDFPRFTDRPYF